MDKNKNQDFESKITNEKPVFLAFLGVEEALAALLKFNTKPTEEKPQKRKSPKTTRKSSSNHCPLNNLVRKF